MLHDESDALYKKMYQVEEGSQLEANLTAEMKAGQQPPYVVNMEDIEEVAGNIYRLAYSAKYCPPHAYENQLRSLMRDATPVPEPDRHMVYLCQNYSSFRGYYYSVEEPRDEFTQVDYNKLVCTELFDLPDGISLEVEDGGSPRFYDHARGEYMLASELITDKGIPKLTLPDGSIVSFQKAEHWREGETEQLYVMGTQDAQGNPTETEATYGILDMSKLEGNIRCVDVDGRTGAMEFTSVTDEGKVIRTAAITIEHLTEELTGNIHFERNHRMFEAVRDIIENQIRVDEAMYEPIGVEGNTNPAVHAVRRAIQRSLEPFADEITGFVDAESVRGPYTFKPLGQEVAEALRNRFPADELRAAFKLAMPDGEALADECLMTRKEAKERLLKAMSNFYDLERSAGLSVEKVNKEILTLAQENQKNKAQQAAR